MASIFTKIINREIPAHIVAENDRYIAFLDVFPLVKGHVLIIPKQEVDYLFDMEDDLLAGMLPFAKNIAKAMAKVVPCKKVGVSVVGLEVPHAHIHLIPMNKVSDMDFSKPKLSFSDAEMKEVLQAIQAHL